MSKFAQAMNASTQTWNGAASYVSPDPTNVASGRVSLFFKGCRGLNTPRLYEYLNSGSKENLLDTFILSFNLRDSRGGKGERALGRQALLWLFIKFPAEFKQVMHLIPEYGRWDDLLQFFPNALKLDSSTVSANFSVHIGIHELKVLQDLQQEIVKLFAKQLKTDLANMRANKPCSLCAKWAPTEGNSQDRRFGLFKTLAMAMGISTRTLRTKYNTPLRAYLEIVEKHMCTGQWGSIDFNKVPSCTMKRLKKAFSKHEPKRFGEWQSALSKKDPKVAKVNAKALHPHELVREIRTKLVSDPVAEAQWSVLVDEVRKLGTLSDTVVVVDTSGSMQQPNCLPLDVAVAMGLIISEVVKGPFHGQAISFDTVPQFCVIPDGDLFTRWNTMRSLPWGGSTNLEGTFKLILDRAKECKLSQEDMPKRLFIVSDQQFNQIDHNVNQTNIERINEMYRVSGYIRPQIVFWNVNGASTDFPITVGEYGTALVSGFSPAIMKSLMKNTDYTPLSVLRDTIDDKRYNAVRNAFNGVELQEMSGIEEEKEKEKEKEENTVKEMSVIEQNEDFEVI